MLFRWAGGTDLFGMRFDISPDEEDYLAPDAYISVYVEENLLAAGLRRSERDPGARRRYYLAALAAGVNPRPHMR